MRKDTLAYDDTHLRRARDLRRNMSVSEKWLWSQIRGKRLGFAFKRQVPVGPYVLDFYCAEAKLAIEVDGEQHLNQASRDAHRDAWVKERGIVTLRIPSLDLFDASRKDCGLWPDRIRAICEERSGRKTYELDRMLESKGKK